MRYAESSCLSGGALSHVCFITVLKREVVSVCLRHLDHLSIQADVGQKPVWPGGPFHNDVICKNSHVEGSKTS